MTARPPIRTVTAEARSAFSEDGWQLRARCRGTSTETFYPPERARGKTRQRNEQPANQVCPSCPVLVECRL